MLQCNLFQSIKVFQKCIWSLDRPINRLNLKIIFGAFSKCRTSSIKNDISICVISYNLKDNAWHIL